MRGAHQVRSMTTIAMRWMGYQEMCCDDGRNVEPSCKDAKCGQLIAFSKVLEYGCIQNRPHQGCCSYQPFVTELDLWIVANLPEYDYEQWLDDVLMQHGVIMIRLMTDQIAQLHSPKHTIKALSFSCPFIVGPSMKID